jgi:NADP-dependent 3-hydroxy acid dehydrogenase YdfG
MQVRRGVELTESVLGPVDILVNGAGVLFYTMMKNAHVEEWHTMVDVNVKGVLNCVGAILGGMVERRRGHIVNISSDGGRKVRIQYSKVNSIFDRYSNLLRVIDFNDLWFSFRVH